jgi:hypothetical protein
MIRHCRGINRRETVPLSRRYHWPSSPSLHATLKYGTVLELLLWQLRCVTLSVDLLQYALESFLCTCQ